jgi:hypothetical protein
MRGSMRGPERLWLQKPLEIYPLGGSGVLRIASIHAVCGSTD